LKDPALSDPGVTDPGVLVGPLDDPFSPALLADPYPRYQALRATGPAVPDPDLGVTWVSRHADILAVLHDPETFSSDIGEALRAGRVRLLGFEPSPEMDAVLAEVGGSPPLADDPLLAADPPDHTRVRKLVATAFTPRRVAALEPAVVVRAEALVDEIVGRAGRAAESAGRGSAELVAGFARPLPLQVMAALLGAEGAEVGQLQAWSDAYVAPIGRRISGAEQVAAMAATTEMTRWFNDQVRQARTRHGDQASLVSRLAAVEVDGDGWRSDAELVAVLQTLLVAGNVTTTSLIAEALWRLLVTAGPADEPVGQPVDRAIDPTGDLADVVEEALRIEPPAQVFYRMATRDTSVGGTPVAAGTVVALLYGSANHDDAVFADPSSFCPGRTERAPHLAFGHGIHACLGAALARMEARVSLAVLTRRLPELRLVDGWAPEHGDSLSLRGLVRLPVTWRLTPS
jgi:cytochrome P450